MLLTLTEERFFRLCLQADLFLIFYNDCRGLLKAVFLIAFNVIPLFLFFGNSKLFAYLQNVGFCSKIKQIYIYGAI